MQQDASTFQPSPALPPPRSMVGPIGWMRAKLFSSWTNTLLTIVSAWLVYKILVAVIDWAFLSAVWSGTDGSACRIEGAGACWAFVKAKFGQFLYGRYPAEERWRVDLVYLLAIVGFAWLLIPPIKGKSWGALWTFYVMPLIAYWLLTGSSFERQPDGTLGLLSAGLWDALWIGLVVVAGALLFAARRGSMTQQGATLLAGACLLAALPLALRWFFSVSGLVALPIVKTELWGGMLVTMVVATVGITCSFPIGIMLALGRRSKMPIARWASVGFIEFVRGVPLITVLFMASVMLPLFLPEGVTFDKLLRVLVGVSFFAGAYMAETIRGGLQAIPRGQYEAADALGLSYPKKMGLIVLPQALKLVIPGIVNSFVGLFKDTSLVLIIGMFDLLGIVQLNLSDANWFAPQMVLTAYAFVGLFFWVFCFGMTRYSAWLEKRLAAGERR
jgi:general L-amino acid transport system permease protein